MHAAPSAPRSSGPVLVRLHGNKDVTINCPSGRRRRRRRKTDIIIFIVKLFEMKHRSSFQNSSNEYVREQAVHEVMVLIPVGASSLALVLAHTRGVATYATPHADLHDLSDGRTDGAIPIVMGRLVGCFSACSVVVPIPPGCRRRTSISSRSIRCNRNDRTIVCTMEWRNKPSTRDLKNVAIAEEVCNYIALFLVVTSLVVVGRTPPTCVRLFRNHCWGGGVELGSNLRVSQTVVGGGRNHSES